MLGHEPHYHVKRGNSHLSDLLPRESCLSKSRGNRDVCFSQLHWSYQWKNSLRDMLTVCVKCDDNVTPQLQCDSERVSQSDPLPRIGSEAYHPSSGASSDRGGTIFRTIVYDYDFGQTKVTQSPDQLTDCSLFIVSGNANIREVAGLLSVTIHYDRLPCQDSICKFHHHTSIWSSTPAWAIDIHQANDYCAEIVRFVIGLTICLARSFGGTIQGQWTRGEVLFERRSRRIPIDRGRRNKKKSSDRVLNARFQDV